MANKKAGSPEDESAHCKPDCEPRKQEKSPDVMVSIVQLSVYSVRTIVQVRLCDIY